MTVMAGHPDVRAPEARGRSALRATVAALDALPVLAVILVAWWTILYHPAVALQWSRGAVGAMYAGGIITAVAGLAWWRWSGRPLESVPTDLRPVGTGRPWGVVGVALAGLAAAWAATGRAAEPGGWRWFWLASAAATVTGIIATLWAQAPGRSGLSDQQDMRARPVTVSAVALIVLLAITAAIGSLLTQRPDADDVFLVNRTSYVAENSGALPTRDTIFSDQYFAVTRPDTAPTSIESLLGVVAAWTGLSGPTVTYLVFGPLVAALAVLALWRQLRTLGARAAAPATLAAAAFLLLDGSEHASFGNLGFARAWQGKVMFLIVVVPVLWHAGLRWARDGGVGALWLLGAAHVAGIGLTNSAAFLAPAITAAVVVGGAAGVGRWGRIIPGLLMTLPAVAFGLAFALLPRQPVRPDHVWAAGPGAAVVGAGVDVAANWFKVFGAGPAHLVPVFCVLVAWLLVSNRSARLALALAPAVVFLGFLAPGVPELLVERSGADSILWRVAWVLPVPAAVGLALTAPLRLRPPALRVIAAVAVPVLVLGAMALREQWVLSPDNERMRLGGVAWDVDPTGRAVSDRLLELSNPGDVVLAPETPSGVLAIRTSLVRTVNPRGRYMVGRHAVTEFRGPQRSLASEAVTVGVDPARLPEVAEAVGMLSVDTVCVDRAVPAERIDGARTAAGFAPVAEDRYCRYWR